jgi:hypothetical protein
MILHHVSNGDEERLHPPDFPQIPIFPPRRGAMINVVSQDEDPPAGGEIDQQRLERLQRNTNRTLRRINEEARLAQLQADDDQQEADRHNRL